MTDDALTVCRTHLRFVPCRRRDGCDLSSDPADVSRVRAYQESDRVRRVQELRRSSASAPVPSGRVYRRRPKHRDRPEEPKP